MSINLTDEQLVDIKKRMLALPEGPWFVSDCEGELQVWREGALRHVTRNESGEIDGYSLPGSYSPSEDLIAEWDIETWDVGEDPDDDTRREVAYFLAAARGLVPELVEEIERLRADIARAARQAADGMVSASELLAELAKRSLPA